MWKCKNCNETSNDEFVICWNCQAAKPNSDKPLKLSSLDEDDENLSEATRDEKHQAILHQKVLDEETLPEGYLTYRHIVEITLRLLAVWYICQAIVDILRFLFVTGSSYSNSSSDILIIYAVSIILYLGLGFILWCICPFIARRVTYRINRRITGVQISFRDVLAATFVIIGLTRFFPLINGIGPVFYQISRMSNSELYATWEASEWIDPLLTLAISSGVGILLIAYSNRLAEMTDNLRMTGSIFPESGEEESSEGKSP
ncbi:MAG: hypothetical protein ACKVH8_02810 [Pirellulales bacterium]|jgi:hypothetical protein